jgi:hypothetical protein
MKNIRTFTEQIDGSPVLAEINKAFDEADLLIILGFGFHQQNMKLFVPDYGDPSRWRPRLASLIATVFGLDDKNHDALCRHMRGPLRIEAAPMLVNMNCGDAMSKLRLSISMAAA